MTKPNWGSLADLAPLTTSEPSRGPTPQWVKPKQKALALKLAREAEDWAKRKQQPATLPRRSKEVVTGMPQSCYRQNLGGFLNAMRKSRYNED